MVAVLVKGRPGKQRDPMPGRSREDRNLGSQLQIKVDGTKRAKGEIHFRLAGSHFY